MTPWCRRGFLLVGLLALLACLEGGAIAAKTNDPLPLLMVVLDPLSKELACACVKGYGQRDYRKLAAKLKSVCRQDIRVEFSDDLVDTLTLLGPAPEVMVLGERSVVAQGLKRAGLQGHAVCELTGMDGAATLTGAFVTRSDDPAKELKDIGGRTILFGLADLEENRTAVEVALHGAGVRVAEKPRPFPSYSDAALDVLDSRSSPPLVGVVPSYVLPLLEGCGSIKPGELKVIGKTEPIPFITVFLSDRIPVEKQKKILQTLLDIKTDAKLLQALETRDGFRPLSSSSPGQPQASLAPEWPDWRGPGRDGHVPRLPSRLPSTPKILWKKAGMAGSLAGLSVSGPRLILAERDFGDENDVYRCLNADNGELLWRVEFPARGRLDYGQSPRATPIIHGGRAYLLGAFGGLRCVDVLDGKVLWQRSLPSEFRAALPTWGMCATPLIVDDLLIVNPGATNASLAALDCQTGETRWTTPGLPAAYAAFIVGDFGGRRQLVGYDRLSLGGWDPKTGERLWQLTPPVPGDFNVPTPIAVNGGLLVSTENNGTRVYHFDESGRIIPKPVSVFADLAPVTATPVVTCGRVFGTHLGLRCLGLQNGLTQLWYAENEATEDHATLIADDARVLVITLTGELLLLDALATPCTVISRLRVFDEDSELYSHPALVGSRLYGRAAGSVVCLDLGME